MNYALFESLCRAKKTTPTALTQKLGLSKGNASSWKKNGNPSADILIKLADELDCTTDELLGRHTSAIPQTTTDEQALLSIYKTLNDIDKGRILGKAEELAEAAARAKEAQKSSTPTKSVGLDTVVTDEEPENEKFIYLDFPSLPVSAGTGVYIDSDYTDTIKVPDTPETRAANYALRVSGDSMEPRYFDGDVLLIETQPAVDVGEVGIFIYNGEAYVKEFGGDCLISLNSKYDDIPITDPDSFYCKGRVIGVLHIER